MSRGRPVTLPRRRRGRAAPARRRALLPLLVLLGAGGCAPTTAPRFAADRTHPLQAYVTAEPDSTGNLRPLVMVSAPRRSLIFYRSEDRIRGGLDVTVVARRDGGQVGGGAGQSELVLPDWAGADSDSTVRCAVPLLLEGDGPVELLVAARSLGSQRTWQRRLAYDPAQLARLPYDFRTFTWNLAGDRVLGAGCDTLRCRVEVARIGQRRPAGARPDTAAAPRLGLSISGPDGFRLVREHALLPPATPGGVRGADFAIPAAALACGRLRVVPYLVTGDGVQRLVRPWQPGRETVNYQVDVLDDDVWSRQVSWLTGLFPPARLASLADLARDERPAAWAGLWAGQEAARRAHLDRIVAADRRFTGQKRGSLTDRGRAWIRYGEPDKIDRLGDEQSRDRRWEIWTYEDLALRLTFLDAHGLGDFRLLETDTLHR